MSFWRNEIIQPALDRDVDAAEAEQWAILGRDPQDAGAYAALGALAHFRGDREAAIGFYKKALGSNPSCTEAHAGLGRIYVVQGLYDEAWKHARDAERLGDRSLVEQLERYPDSGKSAELGSRESRTESAGEEAADDGLLNSSRR